MKLNIINLVAWSIAGTLAMTLMVGLGQFSFGMIYFMCWATLLMSLYFHYRKDENLDKIFDGWRKSNNLLRQTTESIMSLREENKELKRIINKKKTR